ncbi:hypothetical protein EB061_00195 [bacterium]|jgi:Tfp pilus assembly protein PilE|nr:hypothetical protein [bacterium]
MNGPGNSISNSTDEIRYRSYLTQLERDQESQLKNAVDEHREKMTRVLDQQQTVLEQMRNDYDVRISSEAEMLDRKLSEIRERNGELAAREKLNGEQEADKIHAQYTQRIAQEKALGEEQLRQLQSYFKQASEDLHRQYEREQLKVEQKRRPT